MTKLKWLLAVAAGVVVLVVGGTWIYINVIREDAPPPLALDDPPPDDSAPDDAGSGVDPGLEGTWTTTSESIAGFRVNEILFGQSVEAVGRTDQVDGTVTIEGTTVTDASFEVDMASVASDEDRRDGQFRGRIMDVESFPTSTLVLTEPIDLGADAAADGASVTVDAQASLTLRGTTMPVTITLEAQRDGGRMEIVGSLPIVFADWGIPNPSVPGISTEDQGLLEVLLVLEHA